MLSPSAREFLMIGVCGGYTTFSSFSIQTLTLAQEGEWLRAAANSIASFALCLVAVWLGHFAVTLINKP
jgi:CrcB protein